MPSTTSRRTPRAGKQIRNAKLGTGLVAVAASASVLTAAAPAAAHTSYLTSLLRQGSRGPAVARVQRAMHLHRSGRFDRRTKRAVIKFQRKGALLVDGIVGPQTWDALFHLTPPPVTSATAHSYSASSGSYSTSPGASSASASTGSGGYSIPSSIVQCESGGSYSAVNSSSGAGGAYQIMPSTWQAYGGQGLPRTPRRASRTGSRRRSTPARVHRPGAAELEAASGHQPAAPREREPAARPLGPGVTTDTPGPDRR